ncbi:hypothetical protein C5167_000619 [Papaver somniferum]|uniref:Uncharacterized protein n=1 Tax=Papaver somniferum TaxID=3469 RepID=A0A4Y7KSY4_PAPSO|nr:hypothetical protein C5167_000619 [Papaver somniferum]
MDVDDDDDDDNYYQTTTPILSSWGPDDTRDKKEIHTPVVTILAVTKRVASHDNKVDETCLYTIDIDFFLTRGITTMIHIVICQRFRKLQQR